MFMHSSFGSRTGSNRFGFLSLAGLPVRFGSVRIRISKSPVRIRISRSPVRFGFPNRFGLPVRVLAEPEKTVFFRFGLTVGALAETEKNVFLQNNNLIVLHTL